MAINNTITKPAAQPKNEITFTANGENVKLSPATVRQYLVNGGGAVTDQEVVMFMSLCKYQHLNPFLKEAYLVKYGSSPATMVTGKDVFLKRANRNPKFRGMKAGIIVQDKESGEWSEREGTFYIKSSEDVVGGYASVFVEGREPYTATVSFEEYAGRKGNGELNSQWATKPATMIRKVALVQALREAFPEDFAQLYAAEEMGVADGDVAPVIVPQTINEDPKPTEAPVVEAPPMTEKEVEDILFD